MPMDGVHDRLSLRDHIVEVEIGAFQAERDMTQRVSFDVVVEVAAPKADLDDDVDQILSYDRLTWAIEHELAAERLNLLETLAERIADRILAEPQALIITIGVVTISAQYSEIATASSLGACPVNSGHRDRPSNGRPGSGLSSCMSSRVGRTSTREHGLSDRP